MAGTHDTIVLVHDAGDSGVQGEFLVRAAEPLARWLAENGGEQVTVEPVSIRRGPRPARLALTGRLPDPDRPGATRNFDWHLVEARWSDEFAPPPERAALLWTLRGIGRTAVDQVAYYDTAWRFWQLVAHGRVLRWIANAPRSREEQAWRYRYDLAGPFWRYKVPYALWFGLIAPMLFLVLAAPVIVPTVPLWLVRGVLGAWQRAYWNAWQRLLLALVWLPVLALAAVLLSALLVLTVLPVALPGVGALRRGVLALFRLRWLDTYAFEAEWVNGSAIEETVGSTIVAEIAEARSLTVVGYGAGSVIAFETLSALARPVHQPELQTPYVSVAQALSAIDRPLPQYGLPVTLVTVGSGLNRALAARRRPILIDALPEGTRWVDIWAPHDPVAMGSVSRALIGIARAPVAEVRATNAAGPMRAHCGYWANTTEVASTIVEEVIAASARVRVEPDGALPIEWEPRAAGLWEWRMGHGRADRACSLRRQARIARGLAVVRVVGYLGVAGAAGSAFAAGGPAYAAAVGMAASLVYLIGSAMVEAAATAFGRRWIERACRHSSAARVAAG